MLKESGSGSGRDVIAATPRHQSQICYKHRALNKKKRYTQCAKVRCFVNLLRLWHPVRFSTPLFELGESIKVKQLVRTRITAFPWPNFNTVNQKLVKIFYFYSFVIRL